MVDAQGESTNLDERVYFATDAIPVDTAPPVIRADVLGTSVLARGSDNETPNMPYEWESITATWDGGEAVMTWYGENLFTAAIPEGATGVQVCATDKAGNETCVDG